MALRSTPSTQQPSDEEEEEEEKEDGGKEAEHVYQTKEMRHVRFKGELAETPVIPASPPQDRGSDSAEDVPDSFLTRREQNIKANKAMVNAGMETFFLYLYAVADVYNCVFFFILQLAQLMADLQKMPGGAGLLRKQAAKQKRKERSSVSEAMSSVINFQKL